MIVFHFQIKRREILKISENVKYVSDKQQRMCVFCH